MNELDKETILRKELSELLEKHSPEIINEVFAIINEIIELREGGDNIDE